MMNKKIDSPLAKYSGGTLICVLCNTQVKNEKFWTGHVNGRVHRDNLVALKRKRSPDDQGQQDSSTAKRSKPAEEPTTSACSSPFLVPQVPQLKGQRVKSSTPTDSNHKNNNGISSSTDNFKNPLPPPPVVKSKPADLRRLVALLENSDLPAVEEPMEITNNSVEGENEESEEAIEEAPSLPEGFFDDPKKDARARGKVWTDPEQLEWDTFIKEIAVEEVKSTDIQKIDEEESTKSRELDEIEEQMNRWQRVILLEKRAAQLAQRNKDRKNNPNHNQQNLDVNDDDDEDIDEEEFNWRSKKTVIKK